MFYLIFLLPVLKRKRGGKGKAEPLKPIFLLIFEWMELKKVVKNSLFHPLFPPLFPHFPSLSPVEGGKGKKSNQKVRKN